LQDLNKAVGSDGIGDYKMTTMTQTTTRVNTNTLAIAFTALIGLGIVIFAGHVQASTLHSAAHDVRHASGFPCH
jgi:cobalt transporter subunit CbtB